VSAEAISITAADLADGAPVGAALLALNTAHEVELSPLGLERLRHLVGEAFVAWRIEEADAMLIVFDQEADYDSQNFLWFRDRFKRFVYVDRIVVAPTARGRGYARALYQNLFEEARLAGHELVGCEVNSQPPNPGSDAFHQALGFEAIGTGLVGGKSVRYMTRGLRNT
jgi:predicted GNAT superfamily acetyltransferase